MKKIFIKLYLFLISHIQRNFLQHIRSKRVIFITKFFNHEQINFLSEFKNDTSMYTS